MSNVLCLFAPLSATDLFLFPFHCTLTPFPSKSHHLKSAMGGTTHMHHFFWFSFCSESCLSSNGLRSAQETRLPVLTLSEGNVRFRHCAGDSQIPFQKDIVSVGWIKPRSAQIQKQYTAGKRGEGKGIKFEWFSHSWMFEKHTPDFPLSYFEINFKKLWEKKIGDWRVNKERNTNLRKRFKSPPYFSPNHAVKADLDAVSLLFCV